MIYDGRDLSGAKVKKQLYRRFPRHPEPITKHYQKNFYEKCVQISFSLTFFEFVDSKKQRYKIRDADLYDKLFTLLMGYTYTMDETSKPSSLCGSAAVLRT